MLSKISLVVAVIVAFYIAWSGGQSAYSTAIEDQVVSPGDIVINEVSTAGEDWVRLYNNLDRTIDLHGYIFTDGDSRFVLPKDSNIEPGGELLMASRKDEGKISESVDYYWGDWGLSGDGEMVMLINSEGNMVVDFVFTPELQKGEKIQRIPNGIGPMIGPDQREAMQLKRPSYKAVPIQSIKDISKNFSTSVVSFGGLLTTLSTILINFDQTREVLEKFGLTSKKKKTDKES